MRLAQLITKKCLPPSVKFEGARVPPVFSSPDKNWFHIMSSLCTSAPSSAPTNVTILSITSTTFTLSWSPPPPEDHNGLITEYQLLVMRLSTLSSVSLSTNGTVLTVCDLVPYSGYEVAVSALTNEGSGPYTDPIILQTEQDGK